MIPLETIHIAKPCHADWDAMTGDAQVRHCGQCRKNVYNLSEMTRAQAEALVMEKEGRLCVRFYTRADGTVLTQDCPVGLRAFRLAAARKLSYAAALLVAGLAGLGRGTHTARAVTVPAHAPKTSAPAKAVPDAGRSRRGWLAGGPMRPEVSRSLPLMGKPICPPAPPKVIAPGWTAGAPMPVPPKTKPARPVTPRRPHMGMVAYPPPVTPPRSK